MTANATNQAPAPAPRHGKEYKSVIRADNGETYRNDFRFNGYEFNTPASQAFHEAGVICSRHRAALLAVVVAPVLYLLVPLSAKHADKCRLVPLSAIQYRASMK